MTRREGGRAARHAAKAVTVTRTKPVRGGHYRPLSQHEIERIHDAALTVLEEVGMGQPAPELARLGTDQGLTVGDDGRLRFPRAWVEDMVATLPKRFTLYGRAPGREVELGAGLTHYATGGTAVRMLDMETGEYRPSVLQDVYECAQVADACENLHVFNRTVVASDLTDPRILDICTAYSLIAGTTKPIGTGFYDAAHVPEGLALFDYVLGGDGEFAKRPFSTCNTCAIVPPLTYGYENTEVAIAAARLSFPIKMVTAAQSGATAPAALAGTLVQTIAETLAGCAIVHLAKRGTPVIFANYPFVSDLRTGSFSGGGGEIAVMAAASTQIARWYGLPNATAAGMTDAKEPDAQYGWEKGVTDLAAGLSGPDIIYESGGMLGSLIGCSLESLVIDNEMLGHARQTVKGIEVTDESLSVDVIRDVCLGGPGHFLGHAQTLELMNSEYVYPVLGNRDSPDAWHQAGRPDIREKARARAREILASSPPNIPLAMEQEIARRLPIRRHHTQNAAGPGSGTAGFYSTGGDPRIAMR
jgi:trimethylamine--corrinoid protein Co-methyltransferase